MINPDLQDCTYTAEVLRTRTATADVATRISEVATAPRNIERLEGDGGAITLIHAFTGASRTHHRAIRKRTGPRGEVTEFPRQKSIGGGKRFFYDVLIAQRQRHTILAVPFHGLAEEFFPRVDRELAGTRTAYERLDITNIVLALGRRGRITLPDTEGVGCEIGLTRCHLAYADEVSRSRDLQSVHITGANVGTTEEYRFLIEPVLGNAREGLRVTPLVLGFSLYVEGVKKVSAITDRHGNFKVFVGPGLRQVLRLFDLLSMVERMDNVVSTTTNLPIMQSRGIREESSE